MFKYYDSTGPYEVWGKRGTYYCNTGNIIKYTSVINDNLSARLQESCNNCTEIYNL